MLRSQRSKMASQDLNSDNLSLFALPTPPACVSMAERGWGGHMIENPPLLTIHRGHGRPGPALIEAFRGALTSHLVDAMEGRGAVDWQIKPLDPANASFVGPALTAHSYPAESSA